MRGASMRRRTMHGTRRRRKSVAPWLLSACPWSTRGHTAHCGEIGRQHAQCGVLVSWRDALAEEHPGRVRKRVRRQVVQRLGGEGGGHLRAGLLLAYTLPPKFHILREAVGEAHVGLPHTCRTDALSAECATSVGVCDLAHVIADAAEGTCNVRLRRYNTCSSLRH